MKTFKDFISGVNEAKFKKGDKVTILNAKTYDVFAGKEVEGTVMGLMGKDTVMVDTGKGQINVDIKDVVLNESDVNEEDFSKLKPLIDKDVKQIRDNLFADSKTIGKVIRTLNAQSDVDPKLVKSFKEVEDTLDKARQLLTKL